MKQLKASIWATLLLTAACSQYEDESTVKEQSPCPVTFDTYLTADGTRAAVSEMDYDQLRQTGFGVFAATHSIAEGDGWEAVGASTTQNFMYNQLVTATTDDNNTYSWTYSPLKYWPNELKEDGQGATTEGKEGLSFFAYAPYTDDHTVIDNITINHTTTSTGNPAIGYTAAEYPNEGTDLLWAIPMPDQPHPTTSEKVKFTFHHACVRLGLKVRANPDEGLDQTRTRILIESVEIAAVDALQSAGSLSLNSPQAGSPQWTITSPSTPFSLTADRENLNTNLIYSSITPVGIPNSGQNENGFSARTRGDGDSQSVAQQFAALKPGVTTTAAPLLPIDYYYTLIPRTDAIGTNVSIPVTIVYHVVTLDSSLPSGFSDIKNTCKATATLNPFKAGYRYNILLSLGLKSVKAEATATTWTN